MYSCNVASIGLVIAVAALCFVTQNNGIIFLGSCKPVF
jgi:hypothetical protein